MAFNTISVISWRSVLPFIITYVVFSGVRVSRYLVFYVYVLYIVVCPICFGHCVVCSSSICGFWQALWHFQTLLLVEEAGVPWEKYRPATSHWQTVSPNVISSTLHQHVLYFFFLPSYSALLRITACEFHFGCFKMFFQLIWRTCNYLKGHTIKMKS